MRQLIKRSAKAGLPPGSLIHLGKGSGAVRVTVIDYTEKRISEKSVSRIEDAFPYRDKKSVTWINVDGVHDIRLVEKLGVHYGLHPLVLEDVLNTAKRPKMEDFGGYLFIVLKMLTLGRKEVQAEQLSLIIGKRFVISFQEAQGDVFDPIRNRLRQNKGNIRKQGPDYLGYALIDAIVDSNFTILERFGDQIDLLEDELVARPRLRTMRRIHHFKRELIFVRNAIWPLREVVAGLERSENPLVQKQTWLFFKDIHDHVVESIDTLEIFREMVSGMLDIYLSNQNNRLNEVIKVLTIIGTIFMPLTFIVGVYGMNFRHMPELSYPWAYPVVIGLMVVLTLVMLLFFRRKRWI
ncbi:MAG: magnesium/cobalt transporter CorA [Nanoarchaeota archaeon]